MNNIIEIELAKKDPQTLLEIKKIEEATSRIEAKCLAVGISTVILVLFLAIAYMENNCAG